MEITSNRVGRGRTGVPPRILAAVTAVVIVSIMGLTGCQPVPHVNLSGGRVVRWNPCETIEYQIDPRGGQMTFTSDIHEAFRAASMASGIRVRYAGRGNANAPHSDEHDPVLVSYGNAGATGGWAEAARNGREIVGGTIVIDPQRFGNSRRMHRRLVFHEIGHILGLEHPTIGREAQVMGMAFAPYRSADLAGFRLVGRHRGDRC